MRWMLTLGLLALAVSASPVLAAGGSTDPLHIRFDTALWATVVFVALLIILRAKAWGPILEGLQKREATIRNSLEEAKQTRAAMEKMRAEFQQELAEAHQQIPKLLEEARRDAEALSNEIRAKAASDISAERDRLRREVELAKDQAIKELWEQAAQLATLISAKAIERSLTLEDHHRLIDEALKEMRHAVNN